MNQLPVKNNEEFYQILRQHLRPEHAADTKIAEFISKYLVCRNAPQAAEECGLTKADGRYLFQQMDIYTAIEKLTEAAVVKYGYDAAEIVERTKEIAFSDPADLMDASGRYFESLKDIPPEARRTIKKFVAKNIFEDDENGIPQYRGKLINVEFWDKPKTLELLAREKDTFKKTTVVEHDVSKNARSYLLASLDRANERIDGPKDVTPVPEPIEVEALPIPSQTGSLPSQTGSLPIPTMKKFPKL